MNLSLQSLILLMGEPHEKIKILCNREQLFETLRVEAHRKRDQSDTQPVASTTTKLVPAFFLKL